MNRSSLLLCLLLSVSLCIFWSVSSCPSLSLSLLLSSPQYLSFCLFPFCVFYQFFLLLSLPLCLSPPSPPLSPVLCHSSGCLFYSSLSLDLSASVLPPVAPHVSAPLFLLTLFLCVSFPLPPSVSCPHYVSLSVSCNMLCTA